MSSPLLLNGQVDTRDEEISTLRRQLRQMDEALRLERSKTGQIESGVRELRHVLTPLYRALQKVYGEMDEMGVGDFSPSASHPMSKVWERWKNDLGPKAGELIEALLHQREMSAVQLRVVMHCHINTVYEITAKMQKLGLLNKTGGKYSLKEL